MPEFLALTSPYTCATPSNDAFEQAVAFDEGLAADNPIRGLTLSWLAWLYTERDEWEQALKADQAAARIYQTPYTFMHRAMVLNHVGRADDAKTVIQRQRAGWPGFDPQHFITVAVPRLCSESTLDGSLENKVAALLDIL